MRCESQSFLSGFMAEPFIPSSRASSVLACDDRTLSLSTPDTREKERDGERERERNTQKRRACSQDKTRRAIAAAAPLAWNLAM